MENILENEVESGAADQNNLQESGGAGGIVQTIIQNGVSKEELQSMLTEVLGKKEEAPKVNPEEASKNYFLSLIGREEEEK